MATSRWLILVGVSAISACGQKSSEPAPAPGSAAPATPPKAAISAPERPALTGSDDSPDDPEPAPPAPVEPAPPQAPADLALNPGQEFERQTRDPTWAGPTEIEIKKRVTKLGGRVDTTECRHDRCLISLRGSEDQMTDLIAKLESPAGLQGYAQSIYLTGPVEQGGKLVVRAYATFDR
jgi:hypothetical protein